MSLDGRRVLVGLSGGIACYKACEVVRAARAGGRPRPGGDDAPARSSSSRRSRCRRSPGAPVATDTFDLTQESEIGHIRLADEAEVVVLAPATANVHREAGARHRRRSAHDGAARDARAGRRRAGHERAHVGAPGDAGQPARAASSAASQLVGPASGLARLRLRGAGPARRAGRDRRGAWRPRWRRRTSRASACWSRPGRRARRSIRCATSPTTRAGRWATRSPAWRAGAAPRCRW